MQAAVSWICRTRNALADGNVMVQASPEAGPFA